MVSPTQQVMTVKAASAFASVLVLAFAAVVVVAVVEWGVPSEGSKGTQALFSQSWFLCV